jgi:hypothetical protein
MVCDVLCQIDSYCVDFLRVSALKVYIWWYYGLNSVLHLLGRSSTT